jgi:hypothetical protein
MKKIYLLTVMALIILVSCKKDLPDIGGTAAQKMANEWWVTFDTSGKNTPGLRHVKIATYNTAANNDSIWIDDLVHIWDVKFKAAADFNNLTFSAKNAANYSYPITVNVTEGKILANMGHSKSGNITDSIHMKIEFEDDPGIIYEINGHARTMFSEDDY